MNNIKYNIKEKKTKKETKKTIKKPKKNNQQKPPLLLNFLFKNSFKTCIVNVRMNSLKTINRWMIM